MGKCGINYQPPTVVPGGDFAKLKSLWKVNLSSNGLTMLPGDLGELEDVGTLDLRWNLLSEVPNSLGSIGTKGQLYIDPTTRLFAYLRVPRWASSLMLRLKRCCHR